MKLQKRIFIDLDDEREKIVLDVLNEYCVPYTRTVKTERGLFYSYDLSNISVELDIEPKDNGISPYNLIVGKIENLLSLEDAYEMPSVEHPRLLSSVKKTKLPKLDRNDLKAQTNELKAQVEYLIKMTQPKETLKDKIYSLFKKSVKKEKKCDYDDIFQKYFDKVPKDRKKDIFGYFKETGMDKQIINEIKERLNKKSNTPVENIIEDKVVPDIISDILSSLPFLASGMPDPKNILRTGEIVQFDDLPKEIKEVLSAQYPISLLRSSKCIIRKNGSSISVEISG